MIPSPVEFVRHPRMPGVIEVKLRWTIWVALGVAVAFVEGFRWGMGL